VETRDVVQEVKALRASRDIHRDFVKYLLGEISFKDFTVLCEKREIEFKTMKYGGVI
jgi:hypothetical protein